VVADGGMPPVRLLLARRNTCEGTHTDLIGGGGGGCYKWILSLQGGTLQRYSRGVGEGEVVKLNHLVPVDLNGVQWGTAGFESAREHLMQK
jgi:hypothetical protein